MLVEVGDRTTRVGKIQRVGHLEDTRRRDRPLIEGRPHGHELAHRAGLECVLNRVYLLRVRVVRFLRIRIRHHQHMTCCHVLDDDGTPVGLVLRNSRIEQFLNLVL